MVEHAALLFVMLACAWMSSVSGVQTKQQQQPDSSSGLILRLVAGCGL
jgi:hypothetical protein